MVLEIKATSRGWVDVNGDTWPIIVFMRIDPIQAPKQNSLPNPSRKIKLFVADRDKTLLRALIGNQDSIREAAHPTTTVSTSTMQLVVDRVMEARDRLARADDLDRHAHVSMVRVVPGPMIHPRLGIESQFNRPGKKYRGKGSNAA